jgi:hypothetical protein
MFSKGKINFNGNVVMGGGIQGGTNKQLINANAFSAYGKTMMQGFIDAPTDMMNWAPELSATYTTILSTQLA